VASAASTGGSEAGQAIAHIAARALDAPSATPITNTICAINARSTYATPSAFPVETINGAVGTGTGLVTSDTSVTA
jgi:hypothetical protein